MTIVALDTATEILSAAVQVDERYFETSISAGLRHSEYLLPVIDNLRKLASIETAFDLVVCMRGPGSFTGLRIGLATAKGLASGSSCPFVAVPTLDVLAHGYEYYPGVVVPVIDARKKRLYTAIYREGERLTEDLDIAPDDLVQRLKGTDHVLFTGPGSRLLSSEVAGRSEWRIDPNSASGRASSLLGMGRVRFEASGPDPDDLGPVYLRESEAETGRNG